METYRLVIRRNEVLLGFFETGGTSMRAAAIDLLKRLPTSEGYRVEVLVSRSERRLVESGPEGLRLLSTEKLFEPMDLGALSL